jgi:hypothetical protein
LRKFWGRVYVMPAKSLEPLLKDRVDGGAAEKPMMARVVTPGMPLDLSR